jgi:hypothetical protein
LRKRREFNLETHIAFIDLEKVFDRINRIKLREMLDKRGYLKHILNVLINMYETKIKIELEDGRFSQEIITNIGVRQGGQFIPAATFRDQRE